MNLRLIEKTYPGECPRPAPTTELVERDKLILLTTPWGQNISSELTHQSFKEFFEAVASDQEATSPFQRLPGLSPAANHLRIGAMLANEAVYQKANKDRYDSACELLALSFNGRELTWLQIGQPSLLLIRGGHIIPLSTGIDLSLDFNTSSVLPSRMLGIDRGVEMETRNTLVQPGDHLLVVSRARLPSSIFSKTFDTSSPEMLLNQVFNAAVTEDPNMPFWAGLIPISA